MAASPATFWRRQAQRTALRHNLGCVLDVFLPLGLGISVVFACALLVARENGVATGRPWTAYGVALLAAAVVAAWRARPRFFATGDALVRLEWHLGLHNRLSAAAAGVGEFPAAQAAPDGYAFHGRKIVAFLAAAAALVWAGAAVPVSRHAAPFVPAVAPVAWTQTAGWIDALKQADAVQEPALEDLRDRLEQLRKQPAEDWYSQSSLEAGDNLREQTAQSLQSLGRDLRSALSSLEAMQRFTDGLSPAELKDGASPAGMKAAREGLENALKGLAMGNLPLNRDLLDGLKQADLSNLKSLTPAQIEAMKKSLQAGDKVCQACLHPGEAEGKLAGAMLTAAAGNATTQRPGGSGGGTESAPMNLGDKPAGLGQGTREGVSNANLDHALPGDLMGVGKGEHPVDPSKYTGPGAGGTVASNGNGGEAIGRNDLTPKEREVLKNFFK